MRRDRLTWTPADPSSLDLTPRTLVPDYIPSLDHVPPQPRSRPPLPSDFSLASSPNYSSPYGVLTLGSTLSAQLHLANISSSILAGVRMMAEVQGPSGRYRLGEAVHDDTPEGSEGLKADEGVELRVESEMKELGGSMLVISVAWETPEGRRTFQRFMRFNVSAKLST